MAESLLAGVRVVDLAGEPAEMAGRILADLGAEVVKVEPEGGDPLRRVGPFRGERRDPDASLRFAAWNAGKTSVDEADLERELRVLLGKGISVRDAAVVFKERGVPRRLVYEIARKLTD